MIRANDRPRGLVLPRLDELSNLGADDVPLLAKRLLDRGLDDALDVRRRSEVSPEGVALLRVEGALEKRAEDRRLHVDPAGRGGFEEKLELLLRERECVGCCEKTAIELEDLPDTEEVPAGVHRFPERLDLPLEPGGRRDPVAFQRAPEEPLG